MSEAAFDEARVAASALGLIPDGRKARLEHATVVAAEVELTDEDRFFSAFVEHLLGKVVDRVRVGVHGHDVAVLRRRAPEEAVLTETDEAAAEVEFPGRGLRELLPAEAEVEVDVRRGLRRADVGNPLLELQLIVDEEADAHRILRRMPKRRVRRELLADRRTELRLEIGRGEVVDVELRMAFHALRALEHAGDVGLSGGERELRRAPVANRVESPRIEPPEDEVVVVGREVLLAELLLEVPDRERHLAVRGNLPLVPCRMLRRVRDVRHDPRHVESDGEEEVPLRRHEPPFAVDLLGAEVPGRLQLRTRRPAAEAVPGFGRGMKMRELRLEVGGEILVIANLELPIRVCELSVLVDERHVLLRRNGASGVRFSFKPKIGEAEIRKILPLLLVRPLHLEGDFRHVVRVDHIRATRVRGRAVDLGMGEQELHRPLLARVESDARVDGPVLPEDRRRVIPRVAARAARGDVHREPPLPRLRQVLDIDGQILRPGEVLSRRRRPLESSPPFGAVQHEDDVIRPLLLHPRLVHGSEFIERQRRSGR